MKFQGQQIRPFSIRKEIFTEYKLPDDPIKIQPRIEISKDKKSSDQVLLRQLALFKFNITSVLQQKNDLMQKFEKFYSDIRKVYKFIAEYNQGDISQSHQIEHKFREIEVIRKQREPIEIKSQSSIRMSLKELKIIDQSQYLVKALIIYKGLLNYGQSLKFQGEAFRLGTLSNFNPKHVQVRFTKTAFQSQSSVMKYIDKMIEQSSRAMESKIRYESNYEKDRFLIQEDKYSNCWKSLQELYSPKQVQFINFEMLNILDAFDKDFDTYKKTLHSHAENCRKYKGVMDSKDLMGRQIQQMQHMIESRDQIISNFLQLSQNDPQQMQRVLIKCDEQQTLIQKNLKIYHINEKLFASYNTQTNLKQYSRQRHTFSNKLNQLENRLTKWNYEYAALKDIVENYNLAEEIINKRAINPKRIGLSKSTSDFERLVAKIEGTNTRKNKQLQILKTNLLANLHQRNANPNKHNVNVNRRNLQNEDNFIIDDPILQKQKSFLLSLHRVSKNQKKKVLIQNHEKIKEFIEYNRKKSQDNKLSSQAKDKLKFYEGKFLILNEVALECKRMRQMQTSRQVDSQSQSDYFEQLTKQHLSKLQNIIDSSFRQADSFQDEVIYQHIYDYSFFVNLFQSETWFQMIRTLQKLQGSFISKSVSFSSKTNVQALKQLIFVTKAFVKQKYPQLTVNMFEIFSSTLFKLTNGFSGELYTFQDFYWKKMTNAVTVFYQRNSYEFQQNTSKQKTIDKSSFFSLPYLIHLNRTSNKNKVLNLDQILTKIVKMIYDQFSNLREFQVFEYSVSLTYLVKYIKNVCSQDQIEIKVLILSKLRRFLTSHLLKSQFLRIYETQQKNHKQISNNMIKNIIGLQGYLNFSDNFNSQGQKNNSFELQNSKFLKGIEQDLKVLVINLNGPYASQFNLQKLRLFWAFQEWISSLKKKLQLTQFDKNHGFKAYTLVLKNEFETFLKLTQSIDWNSIKQSDGFLIRMIRKQNFYIKRQFNKFKCLQKKNIWNQFGQLLSHLIKQLSTQNALKNSSKKQAIYTLNELELKKTKALAIYDKKQY